MYNVYFTYSFGFVSTNIKTLDHFCFDNIFPWGKLQWKEDHVVNKTIYNYQIKLCFSVNFRMMTYNSSN